MPNILNKKEPESLVPVKDNRSISIRSGSHMHMSSHSFKAVSFKDDKKLKEAAAERARVLAQQLNDNQNQNQADIPEVDIGNTRDISSDQITSPKTSPRFNPALGYTQSIRLSSGIAGGLEYDDCNLLDIKNINMMVIMKCKPALFAFIAAAMGEFSISFFTPFLSVQL